MAHIMPSEVDAFVEYVLVQEPRLGRMDRGQLWGLAFQFLTQGDADEALRQDLDHVEPEPLEPDDALVPLDRWWQATERVSLDPDYEYGIQQMARALVKRLPPYLATLGYPPTANGVILPIDPFSVRIAFQSGEHLQVFVLLRLDIGRDEYTFASCIACAVQTRGGTYLYTAPSEPVEGIYPEEALQDPKRWLNMGLQYPIALDTPSAKEPVAKALGGLLAPAIPFLARGQGCRLVKEPHMDLHVVPRPDGILIGHVYDNGDPDLFALWPRVSTDGISTKLGERLQFMWVGGRRAPSVWVGGRRVPSGPDFSFQRTWLSNLRAQGFAKAQASIIPQTRWRVDQTGPIGGGGVERLSLAEAKSKAREVYRTGRKIRSGTSNIIAGTAGALGAPAWAVTTAWTGAKLGEAAMDKVAQKVGLYDPEEDIERLPVAPDNHARILKNRAFLRWFGESKVVDKNGYPKVVYHGTDEGGFRAFEPSQNWKSAGMIFFTDDRAVAGGYTRGADHPSVLLQTWKDLREFSDDHVSIDVTEGWWERGRPHTFTEDEPELVPWVDYFTEDDLEDPETPRPNVDGLIPDPAMRPAVEVFLIDRSDVFDDTPEGQKEAIDWVNDELDRLRRPGIYEVYLSIQNPLIVDAKGANWDAIHAVDDEDGNPVFITTDDIGFEARDMDCDGAIIHNVVDAGPYGGHYESTIYIVFDPKQVKSAYNVGTFDPYDPDIERLDVKQAAKRAYGGLRKVRKGVEAAAAAGAIGATAIGAPGWAAGIALAGQQATGHIMDKAAQKAGLYDGPEEPKSGPAPRRWAAPGWKRKKSPEAPVDRRLFVYYAAPASVAERLEQEGIADARRAPLWIKRRYADQDKAAQEAKGRKAVVFEVDVTGLTLGSHPTSEDAVTFEGPLPATRFRRLPDQGSVERLSASEVIDSGQCLSEDELDEDEVFYHATPSSNVAAILRDGLQPGHGRTFDTEGWSKGKVFVSQGFANAHRWAEYIAEQSGEDVTILQLTPGPWSKGLKLDKVAHEGDNDPCAFYTTKRVPPGLIEAVETVEAA